MRDHRLNPNTQRCLGCGLNASEITDTRKAECDGFYGQLVIDPTDEKAPPATVVISTDEQLALIRPDGSSFTLPRAAMFGLRDLIEDGVKELRAERRSRVNR